MADEVKRRNGIGAFFAVDLTREDAIATLIEDVLRLFGGIDIVVNAAGLGIRRAGVKVSDGRYAGRSCLGPTSIPPTSSPPTRCRR